MNYLHELRKRLIRCCIVTGILFGVLCCYLNPLYNLLAKPLIALLPTSPGLIATKLTSTFLVPFKLAFIVSLVLSAPYLLYQLWCFVAPALYINERKTVWLIVWPSILLFYIGILFAYFIVLPLMLRFFISVTPPSVELRPDINQYLEFTLQTFLAFGLAFEIPIIIVLLIRFGVTTIEQMTQSRRYIIVAAFVIGMLLTPPDVISQTLLAIPLWLLFELGLWISKLMKTNLYENASKLE